MKHIKTNTVDVSKAKESISSSPESKKGQGEKLKGSKGLIKDKKEISCEDCCKKMK